MIDSNLLSQVLIDRKAFPYLPVPASPGSRGSVCGIDRASTLWRKIKILNAPFNLGVLVAWMGQRHDHVIVSLGHGNAVVGKIRSALQIRRQNGLINIRGFFSSQLSNVGPNSNLFIPFFNKAVKKALKLL